MLSFFEKLWSIEWIRAFQQWFGPGWNNEDFYQAGLTTAMEVVTYLGGHETVALLAAIALWVRGRRLAYAIGGMVLLTLATDMALWYTFNVPRPPIDNPLIYVHKQAPVPSFPSGHTVVATAVWGLLAVRSYFSRWIAAAFILVVMISRLYLGMHYVGDVLAGLGIGLLLVVLFERMWPPIDGWFSRRSYRFFVLLGFGLVVALVPFTLLNARAWIALGAALGGVAGLLAEYRYVGYNSADQAPRWWQISKVLLGLAGATAILFGLTFLGIDSPVFDAATFALVALWATWGAPATFQALERRLQALPSP